MNKKQLIKELETTLELIKKEKLNYNIKGVNIRLITKPRIRVDVDLY